MFEPQIYPIKTIGKGFLAVMARPRSGEWLADECAGLRRRGIDLVVSFLVADEALELGLEYEQQACAEHDMAFASFPIIDRDVPGDIAATVDLARALHGKIESGAGVVVHCRAGIGRSGLIAASILLVDGFTVADALALICEKRGLPVPDTEEQVQWLHTHADRFRSG